MNKGTERRILDGFLLAQDVSPSAVHPRESPDFLIAFGGNQIGVEVTRVIEARPRQAIAPQKWEADANRVCGAARREFEALDKDPVVVHLQFKPEYGPSAFRAPGLPTELAALVRDHLRARNAEGPAQANALVNNPHPALTMLYANRLKSGESDWRLGGANSARPATCDDIRATIAGKEADVQRYRQAAPIVWLLVDCDLLGQGVSLLVPDGACQVATSFDAVFCIDFYGSCQRVAVAPVGSTPVKATSRGPANTSFVLTVLGYLMVFGSGGDAGSVVLGVLCGGLGFLIGVVSLFLGLFGPGKYPVAATGILGTLGGLFLWMSIVPMLGGRR
jgi:hypothetical protein